MDDAFLALRPHDPIIRHTSSAKTVADEMGSGPNMSKATQSAWPKASVVCATGLAAVVAAGCTASSPFSNSNDFDRTFIGAAQTWDLDKNSVVSCDEWKQYASTSFRESDGNGDGALTPDEFAVMAKSDRLFSIADAKYYDANSDGRVSIDELTGKQNRAFNLLDKNGDCQIDRNETVQIVAVDKKKDTSVTPTEEDGRRATGKY
jgi:EF hand